MLKPSLRDLFSLLIWLPALALTGNIHAQAGDTLDHAASAFVFFDDETPLHCSLEFDMKKFKSEKMKNKYQEAEFSFYEETVQSSRYKIKIKARGESRRAYCSFPPIKMKFGDDAFDVPYLNAINNQKLVTHCKPGNDFEQNLLEEYLVYKMYNQLTDFSFRVKLLDLLYIDSENKQKSFRTYAFVIEEAKILAERTNAFYLKKDQLGMNYINEDCMLRLSLFQYMIGNPDWSVTGLHNISLVKSKEFGKPLPYAIPFDFDYTGIVRPYYALPEKSTGLTSVAKRSFQGICSEPEKYDRAIEEFNKQKDDILLTINEFDLLDEKSRNGMTDYIGEFYDLINSQNFYKNYIKPYCK